MHRTGRKIVSAILIIAGITALFLICAKLAGYNATAFFPHTRLALARSRWDAANIHSYRMQVDYSDQVKLCKYTITVENDSVTNAEHHMVGLLDYLENFSVEKLSCDSGTGMTVDSMFQLVESPNVTHLLFSLSGYLSELDASVCGFWALIRANCNISYRVISFEVMDVHK